LEAAALATTIVFFEIGADFALRAGQYSLIAAGCCLLPAEVIALRGLVRQLSKGLSRYTASWCANSKRTGPRDIADGASAETDAEAAEYSVAPYAAGREGIR
jgi:hypothetical protein